MVKNYRKRVLILGGYGTFGARIARMLACEPDVQLIVAGRDKFKAELGASRLPGLAEGLRLDRDAVNLAAQLRALHLDLLIHCAGPFQHQDYRVAHACIESGTPYIDIADARRFVCDFNRLSPAAEAAGIPLVSGASSLPALSSAVLAELSGQLPRVHSVELDIAPAHRIDRGLATVRAGFESLGDGFPMLQDGQWRETFAGDQLRRAQIAHPVGERWLCNFDVPDLELFPRALPGLQTARFGTGVQPRLLQLGLALCARLARLQLPATRPWLADLGHKLAAHWPGGSDHGGMQIRLEGTDAHGDLAGFRWQILGLNGDGPQIPAAPAAAMARKMLKGNYTKIGASACWQLLTLDEILAELSPHAIVTAMEPVASEQHSAPVVAAG
ncbi:saccharopine dehydrogenase NADP-binding domain-containing protein [Microbulbifer halophilus]|uniref:Saccharopine dehydrogenase NADP-binding domain-containing protein n=4 Tax=Microbulbifer halophilus TaxID=453963 RepID=A0ABW5EFW2_9GAMM|nr:saccharopine dehydrogenase NADP-binding domain-containing protein [Microbulbifer halophilus]MCW8127977.1 saccharopine dehydrogenase NADP-binding domain-containing protein [Microbulbifer halophilus]